LSSVAVSEPICVLPKASTWAAASASSTPIDRPGSAWVENPVIWVVCHVCRSPWKGR